MIAPYEQLIHTEGGDPGDFIRVNAELCTVCKKCLIVCPVNLWKLENGKAVIRETYKTLCLECGSCWQICEWNAINFNYPKGGTGVVFRRG